MYHAPNNIVAVRLPERPGATAGRFDVRYYAAAGEIRKRVNRLFGTVGRDGRGEWIPAFAGMTGPVRGNDVTADRLVLLRRRTTLEIAGSPQLDDVAGRVVAAGGFALEVGDEGD